jgi:N6-adenosine-specific RNA methylase IME4
MTLYRTIVIDPPWEYAEGWPGWNGGGGRRPLPYASMSTADIAGLPIARILEREGYVFLWTTNRYIEDAFRVVRGWGFTPRTLLVWCKPPRGKGPGGMFAITTEFVVVAQHIGPRSHARGKRTKGERIDTTWFEWPRRRHSEKPEEFYALVERVAHGPYLDMFARRSRLGWDVWGDEAPSPADLSLGLTA